jgi:hypothetical protein
MAILRVVCVNVAFTRMRREGRVPVRAPWTLHPAAYTLYLKVQIFP